MLLAESCLAYLLYFEDKLPINFRTVHYFPLAVYASRHWTKHLCRAGLEGDTKIIDDLVERLFRSKATKLTAFRLHNPDHPDDKCDHFDQRLDMIAEPLYYMAVAGLLTQTRKMIQNGADVAAIGGTFGTALQAASYIGQDKVVELLIASGADVNQEAGVLSSALCAAVVGQNLSTVEILVASGANVDCFCSQPYGTVAINANRDWDRNIFSKSSGRKNLSALQLACKGGSMDVVHFLVSKAVNINAIDSSGRGALHCASQRLHLSLMKYLLSHGAKVDGSDARRTPLQEVVDRAGSVVRESIDVVSAAIHILLQNDPDVKRVSCYRAIENHYVTMTEADSLVDGLLKLLIGRGCRVDKVNSPEESCGKWTALHLAAQRGSERLVSILLDAGVDRSTSDQDGHDPYFIAISNGNLEVASMLENEEIPKTSYDKYRMNLAFPAIRYEQKSDAEILELLQSEGYDLDNDGNAPFPVATQPVDLSEIQCLASPVTTDALGITLLHRSVLYFPYLGLFNFLIRRGLDVNVQDRTGRTPTHHLTEHCAQIGKDHWLIEGLKVLLANGANPNIQDNRGKTLAHLLFQNSHKWLGSVLLEMLLDANADLTIRDNLKKNALEVLEEGPLSEDTQWLFYEGSRGIEINLAKQWFSLIKSLNKGYVEEFEVILERLPSVNFRGPDGETALHCAVVRAELPAVKVLIRHNAKIDFPNNEGRTPLQVCSHFGGAPDRRVMSYLIQHGADATVLIGADEDTVLHMMARSSFISVDDLKLFKMLVEDKKLDINQQNSSGDTPLISSAGRVEELSVAPVVEYLCSQDADVLKSNALGETALGRAVEVGNLQLVEYFCNHGAAVNINSLQVRSKLILSDDMPALIPPLHAAIMSGKMRMVKLLLGHGADVEVLDDTGGNAMHWAARGGQLRMAKLFVKLNVDHNLKNKAGQTPLDLSGRRKRGLDRYLLVEDYLRFGVGREDDQMTENDSSVEDYGESDEEDDDGEEDDRSDPKAIATRPAMTSTRISVVS